ncbi:hypothetical protein [uncultured Cohaesibacter sp.]|uniref:hypothetical protein n=1 Tax=uncultured Cohaesibacter sp. TaxID=1002546 RepID=UPI002AA6A600|nr:hypothetical protein [uncultured Cohaesibacter sp.]
MTINKGNAPIDTIRDGAVSAKIWRNEVESQPLPFYSVTFQRTYTDQATQQVRETHSFNRNEILKVQQLVPRAYEAVNKLRKRDRSELQQDQNPNPQQEQQQGLSQQRDAVMKAAPQPQQQAPAPQREPEM